MKRLPQLVLQVGRQGGGHAMIFLAQGCCLHRRAATTVKTCLLQVVGKAGVVAVGCHSLVNFSGLAVPKRYPAAIAGFIIRLSEQKSYSM